MKSDQRLIEAVVEGDVDTVLRELNCAEINRLYEQRTLLIWAIQEEQLAVVKTLLSKGASASVPDDSGHTPLYQAAAQGGLDIISLLLEAGADVNQDTPDGSPLLLAVAYEHIEGVTLLLSKGADPDKPDKEGVTPRSMAISYGNDQLINCFR